MVLIVIFVKNFISFKTKELLFADLNYSNLFLVMSLMIGPVKVRIAERIKSGLIEPILILVFTIITDLGLSLHNQEQLPD